MAFKKIHIIRHAQAQHNVDHDYYNFPDAVLTPFGKQQCENLNQLTTDTIQKTAQLLVSSPLRRTLQTSLLSLPGLIERLGGSSSIIALPELQENSSSPADTGSSKEDLEQIPEFSGIDFGRLSDQWNSKTGFWSPDPKSLKFRSAFTRRWLADRPEDEIVVVSHGSAIRYLTEEHDPGSLWENTECRTYALFPQSPGSKNFKLVLIGSNTRIKEPYQT